MHRLARIVLSGLALWLLAACGTTPPAGKSQAGSEAGITWILVRHAEKATDDPEDPNLSAIGRERAQRLAKELASTPLVAIYATEYRRTQQTAQPTADAHHLPISPYFSKGPAAESAAQWKAAHARGAVLIVGHSNTVPDLVTALSGQTAAPMPDTEYDRLTRIHVDAAGKVRVEISRY